MMEAGRRYVGRPAFFLLDPVDKVPSLAKTCTMSTPYYSTGDVEGGRGLARRDNKPTTKETIVRGGECRVRGRPAPDSDLVQDALDWLFAQPEAMEYDRLHPFPGRGSVKEADCEDPGT